MTFCKIAIHLISSELLPTLYGTPMTPNTVRIPRSCRNPNRGIPIQAIRADDRPGPGAVGSNRISTEPRGSGSIRFAIEGVQPPDGVKSGVRTPFLGRLDWKTRPSGVLNPRPPRPSDTISALKCQNLRLNQLDPSALSSNPIRSPVTE